MWQARTGTGLGSHSYLDLASESLCPCLGCNSGNDYGDLDSSRFGSAWLERCRRMGYLACAMYVCSHVECGGRSEPAWESADDAPAFRSRSDAACSDAPCDSPRASSREADGHRGVRRSMHILSLDRCVRVSEKTSLPGCIV